MTQASIDLFDMLLSHPPGSFKYFHSEGEVSHIQQSLENRHELLDRINHAKNSNCLIEVISLRLQNMDLWLRIYYNNTLHVEPRKQEFGKFIKQCYSVGLDKKIYDRICAFNKDRRVAIHGYLLGQFKYDDFKKTVEQSDGLTDELINFIILNSGEVVTPEHRSRTGYVGDCIMSVQSLLDAAQHNTDK